ncbi:MAG TPA: FlgD immunoglobulin-like domain containing protein [Termitinemataceae bacterium]|nr:FlgD immunoglobulin-like domain containing protein [Termitinemataceae bacterium]HOM22819.1 FlgD immunoglobulin-like domain containing protein [Termitinemataceae bacterium]HPP99760.1 FlgD immunoglobulin-like domain containing protein [Termitinemataceae bacterium]
MGRDTYSVRYKKILWVGLFILIGVYWAGAEPPNGQDSVVDLFSPVYAGSGLFTTSTTNSQALSLNPATLGSAQRIVLDVGYLGIAGTGSDAGYGNAISLGVVYPTRYAVFGSSLRLITSPFNSMPLGTVFGTDLYVAKELYPGMSFGLGLNLGLGNDWTAAADLGFYHRVGTVGPLHNFSWALSLGGLGKSYVPSPFTLAGGVAFDFFRIPGKENRSDPLVLGAALDLGLPGFTNLTGKVGLSATIARFITISSATGFNVRESLAGKGPSFIPSVGITANFKLNGDTTKEGALPREGEMATSLAVKPLYPDIMAVGAGLTWTLGVADTKGPLITIDYPETRYISPNNDGKADVLEFPISITDSRYVASWEFTILNQDNQVVRTYRNKERRPETQGVRNIIDRILDVKSGVEVPATLRWDGILDDGSLAPDGNYFFKVSAKDDNGNESTSATYQVVVDNTAPIVRITRAGGNTDLNQLKIFSPDGDGNKDTFELVLEGSIEDRWEGGIYNAAGTLVRNFSFTNASPAGTSTTAPASLIWDGKNDTGQIVPDGVYTYRISATDRAQNTGNTELGNIIVNTERPVVSLLINDSFFSPNGDGIKDTLVLSPGVPVKEGITRWDLSILDGSGAVRRIFEGTTMAPPAQVIFDGKSGEGALLPEGTYQAQLRVTYQNGHVAITKSPSFVLDITAPTARVVASYPAFSPNNDGNLDEMEFTQDSSEEVQWTGEIRLVQEAGKAPVASRTGEGTGILMRTFTFSGKVDPRITWDGRDSQGRPVPDGVYEYRLVSTDRAGNRGASNAVQFTLTTADTPVLVNTDTRAFSPNGDRVKDTLTIIPQLQVTEGIASWRLEILDSQNTPVRIFEGRNTVPQNTVWDGKNTAGSVVPDGQYTARLQIRYVAGNQPVASSLPFTVDTQAPQVELSVPYTLFSPNNDGNRDFLPIQVRTPGNDTWTLNILNQNRQVVQSWEWKGVAPDIRWNGTDRAGNQTADGTYSIVVTSTDEAGNTTSRTIEGIVMDSRVPRAFLTASAQAISPNGDGVADTVNFSIVLTLKDGIESWKLELLTEQGTSHRILGTSASTTGTATGAGTAPQGSAPAIRTAPVPPETLSWDGRDAAGVVREGTYQPRLTVKYAKGDQIEIMGAPILVDITGPVLSLSTRPQYFSPDNDGVDDELFIQISARDASPIASWSLEIREPEGPKQLFYRLEGRGAPTERIVWDGRSNRGELVQAATDYPVTLVVTDSLGNTSRLESMISVDVLVIREGNLLKIRVPSIIFRENAADFIGVAPEKVENNLRVIRRIAEILNRFRDYKVMVEGHANPVARTAREEQEVLQPLSEARAKAVMDRLIEYGVDRNRLSYVGRGGTQPVVRWEDRDNWWKNRRVEFILIK